MSVHEQFPELVPPPEAAKILRAMLGYGSVKLLSNGRIDGSGPVFRKAGFRVVYAKSDLEAWARSRLSGPLHSNSDAKPAAPAAPTAPAGPVTGWGSDLPPRR